MTSDHFSKDAHNSMKGHTLFDQLQIELSDLIVRFSDFEVREVIGKGANGVVYLAVSKVTGASVAIKEIKRERLDERQLRLFCREIQVLARCSHPFLLHLIGFTNCYPYAIVTRHIARGSLWSALHAGAALSGDDKNRIALGIAAGMAELHRRGVIHGDLKSLNVLLDDDGLPVICDFGLSRILECGRDTAERAGNAGTPAWMAPELFTSSEISRKSDVYSFGIILWELETGAIPFQGASAEQLPDMVAARQERPPIPANSPVMLKRFMRLCWHPNPEKRPSFQAIVNRFLSRRVFFEGAREETVEQMRARIEAAAQAAPPLAQSPADYVRAVFAEMAPEKIAGFGQWLSAENCGAFFREIECMMEEDAPPRALGAALFELLRLLNDKEECLAMYVETGDFNRLPFFVPELRDVSLAILVPVFRKYRVDVDVDMLYTLETLINVCAVKVARLLVLLMGLDSEWEAELNMKIVDLMIMKGELFIQNGAAEILLKSLYKIIMISPDIVRSREKYCSNIFNVCLTSEDPEIVELAYSILDALRLDEVAVAQSILIMHFRESEQKMNMVLRYLAVANVRCIEKELMNLIVEKVGVSEWAIVVLLKLCNKCKFGKSNVKYFDRIIADKTIKIEYRIRIILSLLSNSLFRNNISKFNNLILLLNEILYKDELDQIRIIKTVLSLIDLNDQYNNIKKYNFIKNLFQYAIRINDDNVFFLIYDIINAINKYFYMDEFLLMVPIACRHLERKDCNFQNIALNFLYLISCNKKSNTVLLHPKLKDNLKELLLISDDEKIKLIQKILSNIEFNR